MRNLSYAGQREGAPDGKVDEEATRGFGSYLWKGLYEHGIPRERGDWKCEGEKYFARTLHNPDN